MFRNRKRAAGIVIKDNKILLIHRFRNGMEYYVTPGGGVEEGETFEEACIRELKEESNLDVKLKEIFFENINHSNPEKYYLIEEFEGQLQLGGPEAEEMKTNKNNIWILEWHNIKDIMALPLKPEEIREEIYKRYK